MATLIAVAFITPYGFFPSWESHTYDNGIASTTIASLPASVVKALYDAGEDMLSRLTAGSSWPARCASWRWCSTGCSSVA